MSSLMPAGIALVGLGVIHSPEVDPEREGVSLTFNFRQHHLSAVFATAFRVSFCEM